MKNFDRQGMIKRAKNVLVWSVGILLVSSLVWFLVKDRLMPAPIITLERTACFGACPIYNLTIYGNGIVIYRGKFNVDIRGIRIAIISTEHVEELVSEFERIDYFLLEDEYIDYKMTDLPFAVTSLTLDDRKKQTIHYLGDKTAPIELYHLEAKIDVVANSDRWICLSHDKASDNTSPWCMY